MELKYEENKNTILNTSNIYQNHDYDNENNHNDIDIDIDKSSIEIQFDELLKSLSNIKPQITSIQNQIKLVEKNVNKEIKQLKKMIERKKNKTKREPSGFAKPCRVSDALCTFMKQPIGTLISRPDATKYLITYIMSNNLYLENDRRYILCDNDLGFLLGLTGDEELTFFSLQRHMNKHFLG